MKKLIWQAVLFCCPCLFLTGCVPLLQTHYDGEFRGGLRHRLDQTAGSNAVLHVVMIHGMGDHAPGYGDAFAQNISKQLGLLPADVPVTNSLVASFGTTNYLREFSYASTNRVIKFHELTWTPTTYPVKFREFAKDRMLDPGRVSINRSIKDQVMDEGMGDAVLYLNPEYRERMQEPILQTISNVVSQAKGGDQIVLVAASLGSKMTFDAVEKWAGSMKASEQAIATNFAARTTVIIMLANQVALLNLASFDTNSLKSFVGIQKWQAAHFVPMQQNVNTNEDAFDLNVVAATDPNDLLSYPIRREDVSSGVSGGVRVSVSNLYSHNASAILGIFVNPLPAHTAYDQNDWLIKMLANGYRENTNANFSAKILKQKQPAAQTHF